MKRYIFLILICFANLLNGQNLRDPITNDVFITVDRYSSGFGPRQATSEAASRYHGGIDYPTETGAGHPAYVIEDSEISRINSSGNSSAYITTGRWRYMHMIDEWIEDIGLILTDVIWQVHSDGNYLTDDDYIIVRTISDTYILTTDPSNFEPNYIDELTYREAIILDFVTENVDPSYPIWRAHPYGGAAHLHFDCGVGSYINPFEFVRHNDNNTNYSISGPEFKWDNNNVATQYNNGIIYGSKIILETEVYNTDDKDTEDIELYIRSIGTAQFTSIFEWHLSGDDHLDAGDRLNGNSPFDYYDVHRIYPDASILTNTSEGFFPYRSQGGRMRLKKHWDSTQDSPGADNVFEKRYPDGGYELRALVRDITNNERIDLQSITVDNYKPFIQYVEVKSGTNSNGPIVYSGGWTYIEGDGLVYMAGTPNELTSDDAAYIEVTTSEPMQNVELIAFGEPAKALQKLNNDPTKWWATYTASEVDHENNRLEFTTNSLDLAGNKLEGFLTTNDVMNFPQRQNNGDWYPTPNENNDVVHSLDVAEYFAPDFSFSPRAGEYPLEVSFEDRSLGKIDSWYWQFSSGIISTEQNPKVTFIERGFYDVILEVSSEGKTKTITRQIELHEGIVADFKADKTSGDYPLTVQFTNLTTENATDFFWDFGDGQSSEEKNPQHTYTYSGTYDVILTASNADDVDTETKISYIAPGQEMVTISGVVEDQDGDPVPGAKVVYRFYNTGSELDHYVFTGVDGRFQFQLVKGEWGSTQVWVAQGTTYSSTDEYTIGSYHNAELYFRVTEEKPIVKFENYSGLTYKFWVEGVSFDIDDHRWTFSNGTVNDEIYGSPIYYTFNSYDQDITYSIRANVKSSNDVEWFTSNILNFMIPGDVPISTNIMATDCEVVPLGAYVRFDNLSSPPNQISRYLINWTGIEYDYTIWDTDYCKLSECDHPEHSIVNDACNRFSYLYNTEGFYNIKFKSINHAGTFGNIVTKSVSVVDCDQIYYSSNYQSSYHTSVSQTSKNESYPNKELIEKSSVVGLTGSKAGTTKKYYGGTYEFDQTLSATQSSDFSACEEIVLKDGFTLSPGSGIEFNFEINDCLKDYKNVRREPEYEEINYPYAEEFTEESSDSTSSIQTSLGSVDENNIMLYPNPTTGAFTLEFNHTNHKFKNIKIYSSMGSEIISRQVDNKIMHFDLDHYPPGTYIILIQLDEKFKTFQITLL